MKKSVLFIVFLFVLLSVCPVLSGTESSFMIDDNGMINGYYGADFEIVIPDVINGITVNAIGPNVFYGNTSLISVTFPESVHTISDYAFSGCSGLQEIYFGNVGEIGNYAFSGCTGLTEIEFERAYQFGDGVFEGCTNLERITFKSAVSGMGYGVFAGCQNLKEIFFEEALEYGPSGWKEAAFYSVGSGLVIWAHKDVIFPRLAQTQELTCYLYAESISVTDAEGNVIDENSFISSTDTVFSFKAAAQPSEAVQDFFWESSDTSTAVVSEDGEVTFKKAGTVTINVSVNAPLSPVFSFDVTCEPVDTSAITITTAGGTDISGTSLSTTKTSYKVFSAASPVNAGQTFNWNSSDKSVATVTSAGKVTFKKAGTVTITVSAKDGTGITSFFTLTCKTVPAEAITLKNAKGTAVGGKSVSTTDAVYQLKAAASPVNARQTFSWSSSDKSVAAVSSAGKVTFKKAGKVTITAAAKDSSGLSVKVTLTCKTVPAAKITVKNANGTAVNGKTVSTKKLNYTFSAAASPVNAKQVFTWTGSNTNIATVTSAGKVTFKKAGTVTITVTAKDNSGVKATFKVKCVSVPATAVKIKNAGGTVINGKTITTKKAVVQFTAAAVPANAKQVFTWTSSNTNIATVTSAGKVTFKKPGTVTIRAAAKDNSGKKASFKLTYKK